MAVIDLTSHAAASSAAHSATHTATSTPVSSTSTSAFPSAFNSPASSVGRGRSERKRVLPAHLRDETVLESDRAPASLKKCHTILRSLMANPKAGPFLLPVDPVALGIPDYFKVIKEPMDFGTIKQNLESGQFEDASVFIEHVRLVFGNAMLYNAAHTPVHLYAQKLSDEFERKVSKSLLSSGSGRKKERKGSFAMDGVGAGAIGGLSSSSFLSMASTTVATTTKSKVKGGRGVKGHSKRRPATDEQGLIMSLKEDIERLKATLEQLQPQAKVVTPKLARSASGSAAAFRMEDLTEQELQEPMTQMEKARLSADIRSLPQDKINRVLQIIAEAVPVAKLANENDEVELDINALDTRCLRMLEGYVRENGGGGRKRKRPSGSVGVKKSKVAAPSNRLKSAKVAALNIKHRKQQLKSQLAAMESGGVGVGGAQVAATMAAPPHVATEDVHMAEPDDENGTRDGGGSSSDSDSSSSSSGSSSSGSDSESESDSDSGGVPLQRVSACESMGLT